MDAVMRVVEITVGIVFWPAVIWMVVRIIKGFNEQSKLGDKE